MILKLASSLCKCPPKRFLLQHHAKRHFSGIRSKTKDVPKAVPKILLTAGGFSVAIAGYFYSNSNQFKLFCDSTNNNTDSPNPIQKFAREFWTKVSAEGKDEGKHNKSEDKGEKKIVEEDHLSVEALEEEHRLKKRQQEAAKREKKEKEGEVSAEEALEVISGEGKKALSLWTILYRYVKSDYVYFFIAIPSAILAAYFNIRINLSLGDLMNEIQAHLQASDLSPASVAEGETFLRNFLSAVKKPSVDLLMNYCAQTVFNFFYLYSLFIMSEQTANRIRGDLFSRFMAQELIFFDQNNAGSTISALSNDVQEFKSSFKQVISLGIKNLAQIIGCVVTLYRISPEMTLAINCVIIPTIALVGQQIGSRLRKISIALQAQLGEITDVAFESINNIRTVKMLALEDILYTRFLNEMKIFDNLNQKFSFGFSAFQSLTNLAFNGIVLVTLLFGGHNLLSGSMTAGSLMSFLATTQTIQRSLFQLSLLYGHYIKLTSSLSRIRHYLALPVPVHSGMKIDNFYGRIVFKDVVFRYPKRPDQTVLKKISLTLQPGKVTALCGTSGSGKSTIAMLLECLYDFDSGSITVDGVDIRSLDRTWLRKEVVGYISQEPILFCTTIMENIRYGNPKASDSDIIEAAKLANAHDFITQFPDGYHTVVGQQGTAVSGGQRQRIAIARAIVKNPKILILDEATSALDSHSEQLVKDALDKVMEGRTVLVIAHRLSTIVNSDQIIVVDHGHVLEQGTHRELLKLKGKYHQLVVKNLDKNQEEIE